MPQCVRWFGAVWFLILISFLGVLAQAPTSGDVMRDRIKKAKALVAVKNYNAAIYELEGIRKETNEPSVNSVAQVMLMNCYLEQSDYKRAQALLTDVFNAKKQNRFGGENYYLIAGQVVRGAKVQFERYKALGLMVSDTNLPSDAVTDINKMRETVEMVVTQSKALGTNAKETSNAMALLEEATGARGNLARDDYDAKHWKDEVADARDGLVNQRGVVDAVGDGGALPTNTAAANTSQSLLTPPQTSAVVMPVADKTNAEIKTDNKPAAPPVETATVNKPAAKIEQTETPKSNDAANNSNQTAQNQNTTAANSTPKTPSRMRKVENTTGQTAANNAATAGNTAKNDAPMAVGSLIEYATAKVSPTYPEVAKTTRMVGIVRVELLVDEEGKPEIQNASGPGMLKQAAQDAVKRWKFKPFTRDGQPVKASGYVSFNFNL
ncbi:MAG: TonB family protein [Pyrinomonadaceae bacterium]